MELSNFVIFTENVRSEVERRAEKNMVRPAA